MILDSVLERFSDRRSLVLAVSLSLAAALILFRWNASLTRSADELKAEYQIDSDLARHKNEHLEAYQAVLASGKLPQAKPLSPNAWIQNVQALAADHKLSLQELKPTYRQAKRGGRRTSLLLVVESRLPDLFNFLYRITQDNNWMYVEELSISTSSDDADSIRAQMTISQLTER